MRRQVGVREGPLKRQEGDSPPHLTCCDSVLYQRAGLSMGDHAATQGGDGLGGASTPQRTAAIPPSRSGSPPSLVEGEQAEQDQGIYGIKPSALQVHLETLQGPAHASSSPRMKEELLLPWESRRAAGDGRQPEVIRPAGLEPSGQAVVQCLWRAAAHQRRKLLNRLRHRAGAPRRAEQPSRTSDHLLPCQPALCGDCLLNLKQTRLTQEELRAEPARCTCTGIAEVGTSPALVLAKIKERLPHPPLRPDGGHHLQEEPLKPLSIWLHAVPRRH